MRRRIARLSQLIFICDYFTYRKKGIIRVIRKLLDRFKSFIDDVEVPIRHIASLESVYSASVTCFSWAASLESGSCRKSIALPRYGYLHLFSLPWAEVSHTVSFPWIFQFWVVKIGIFIHNLPSINFLPFSTVLFVRLAQSQPRVMVNLNLLESWFDQWLGILHKLALFFKEKSIESNLQFGIDHSFFQLIL